MLSLMTRSLQLLTLTLAAVCRTKVVSVTRKCFTSSALIWTVEWVQTCKRCLTIIGMESSILREGACLLLVKVLWTSQMEETLFNSIKEKV